MRVLGISAFYHDSAAALVEDGQHRRRRAGGALHPQEARFRLPAATPCSTASTTAGIKLADVDYVAFYDKPFLKFERLLETYLAFAPRGFSSFRMAMPLWLKEKLFQKTLLRDEMKSGSPTSTGRSACCSASITRATPPRPSSRRPSRRRRS